MHIAVVSCNFHNKQFTEILNVHELDPPTLHDTIQTNTKS